MKTFKGSSRCRQKYIFAIFAAFILKKSYVGLILFWNQQIVQNIKILECRVKYNISRNSNEVILYALLRQLIAVLDFHVIKLICAVIGDNAFTYRWRNLYFIHTCIDRLKAAQIYLTCLYLMQHAYQLSAKCKVLHVRRYVWTYHEKLRSCVV